MKSDFVESDDGDETLERYKIRVLDIINTEINIEENWLLFANIYPVFPTIRSGCSWLLTFVIVDGCG